MLLATDHTELISVRRYSPVSTVSERGEPLRPWGTAMAENALLRQTDV